MDKRKIDGLVKKCQEGDTESFGDIYDIFLTPIYRFIYYKVTHKEVAEDLTEDTFFKAWKNIKQYKKSDVSFSSWLYKVALNTVIDYLRKEKIHIEELAEEIKDEREDATKLAEGHFNQDMLQKALVKLPEHQREAIILKYVNDLTHEEIAEVLEKSEVAVRILLSRGLAKMRDIIEELDRKLKS